MDLSLTESQQMLRNTARSFVEREAPKEVLVAAQGSETGLQADWWRTAADPLTRRLALLRSLAAPGRGCLAACPWPGTTACPVWRSALTS